jgi:3-oxoadipate enol-lactonase
VPLRKILAPSLSLWAFFLVVSLAGSRCAIAADVKQTHGYIEIAGSKIYYEECGGGPNVVLLHDGLLHAVTWDESWGALCGEFHVLRYDRRGYGRSDAPKAKFSPTEDLQQVMAHANMRRAVIVGNSSGGALAIDFALAHPESVDALFLVGPVVHGMGSTDHFEQRGARNQAPLEHHDAKAAALNWSKDPYLIANGHDAARKKFYDALVRSPTNLTYNGQFEIRSASPALRHLGEIHVPVFILAGEFDIPDVHAHCGAIEAGVRWAQRDIVKGDGHLIQLEDPQGFVERLSRYVNLQARAAVDVPAANLGSYTGKYLAGSTVITIGLDHDHLEMMVADEPAVPLFAASSTKFFLRADYLEAEFVIHADRVTELIINEDGRITKCLRLDALD